MTSNAQSLQLQQKPEVLPKRKPQKITQLLCLDQNIELKQIFISWFTQSFKYFPNLLSKIYLQIELLINCIQYRFTVSRNKPQVGDYLQNLKYINLNKKQKIIFLLLDIIVPYLKKRIMLYIQQYEDQLQMSEKIQGQQNHHQQSSIIKFAKIVRFLEKVYSIGNFINLAIFIYNGKYRSLIQRFLKMKMQFMNSESSRVLNFSLMNRNLIWQIYEMALKHILPHASQFIGEGLKNIFYLHSYIQIQDNQSDKNCIFCNQKPTMMMECQPCKHKSCFYCLTQSQNTITCKKCDKQIISWKKLFY